MSKHLFLSPTIFPIKNVSNIGPQRRYSQKVKFNYFLTFLGDNLCCDHLGFFRQANILSKVSLYLEVKMYQKFCPELSLTLILPTKIFDFSSCRQTAQKCHFIPLFIPCQQSQNCSQPFPAVQPAKHIKSDV